VGQSEYLLGVFKVACLKSILKGERLIFVLNEGASVAQRKKSEHKQQKESNSLKTFYSHLFLLKKAVNGFSGFNGFNPLNPFNPLTIVGRAAKLPDKLFVEYLPAKGGGKPDLPNFSSLKMLSTDFIRSIRFISFESTDR